MDRRAAVVRRQCRHDRHFGLRRRAVHGREAQAAASQGDLSVRSARRVRGSRRLPRRISGRRDPSLPLSPPGLCLRAPAERPAETAAARAREAVGRGDGQSRFQDVSAPLQRADAQGAALPGLLRGAAQPVRQRRGGEEERGASSRRSTFRPTPARAGTATRTRRTCSARRTGIATSIRRRRSCCCSAPRISTGRSRPSTTSCCAGTTTGSKASTPEFCATRRCASGSWARTNGAAAATGRCRKPSG